MANETEMPGRAASTFTRNELTIALAVVTALAVAIVSKFSWHPHQTMDEAAQIFVLHSLKPHLNNYRHDMAEFPSTAEGLQALYVAPTGKEHRWKGPYHEERSIPRDPWGQPYQYAYPGIHHKDGYDLWSNGPDKRSGTKDDIGNW